VSATDSTARARRAVLISADCHAGPPVAQYGEYLDPKYRADFADYLAARDEMRRRFLGDRSLFAPRAVARYQEHQAVQSGGRAGLWDSDRRIDELELDGIVAEVVFPDGTEDNEVPFAPFGGTARAAEYTVELRAAGARAHNRWLAEFCAEAPRRRAGVAVVSVHDIDAAVHEAHRAAAAGLRGGIGITPNSQDLPLYDHERYEPLWAACAELDLPVNMHTGTGKPDYGTTRAARMLNATESSLFWSHRAVWTLIWAGVFERYPNLRVVLSENRVGWVPATLDFLDYLYDTPIFADVQEELPRRPSEYWSTNFWVNASFLHAPGEIDVRHRVGVDRLMWGSDYPHVEGTWPDSADKLRVGLEGVAEPEATSILSRTAAELYGFDLDVLAPVADRVGPTFGDLGVFEATGVA
jgi:predicted TIM-barrel fold metal-dependent hydrolase